MAKETTPITPSWLSIPACFSLPVVELMLETGYNNINPSFWPAMKNEDRYLILYGGAGSGKSHVAAQKILYRLLNEVNQRFIICRKVARTIRNSQYRLLKDLIMENGLGGQFTFCEDRMEITCISNGNQVISTGVDDPEKLKSLAKPTGIWIEEATELTAKDFRQLDLRLRAIKHTYVQIILSFNPLNHNHWLYERFMARHENHSSIYRSTWQDNFYIDDQYEKVLEAMLEEDADYFQVYAKGEWGENSQGLIYDYQVIDKIPETDTVIYGMDFGFNNPTVLLKVSIKERELYVEEMIYRSAIVTNEVIVLLKKLIPDHKLEIYADAADPGRIEEISRAGFNIHKARKDVEDGIDHVKGFKIFVLRGSKNLISELDNYNWKQDRNGHYLDAPDKINDHACDALRYAVHTHLTRRKGKVLGFA